ncbi:MAG: hypothetical protein MJ070_05630 [Lachnospiraceae bacterium]|nr:hypothetical protein [Lachnospiraceae bacterium]
MTPKTFEEFQKGKRKKARGFIIAGVVLFLFYALFGLAAVAAGEENVIAIVSIIAGLTVGGPFFLIGLNYSSKAKGQKAEQAYKKYCEEHAVISADFAADKLIKINNIEKIWINTKDHLIQFLLFANTQDQKDQSVVIKNKGLITTHLMVYKTKVFSIKAIKNCELIQTPSVEKHYAGNGIRTSSSVEGGVQFGSLDISESMSYDYQIQFSFQDIDCPFLVIFFGKDGYTANSFKNIIDMLRGN